MARSGNNPKRRIAEQGQYETAFLQGLADQFGYVGRLLREGILKGLISPHFENGAPKYVWSVDANSRPYEAKLGLGGYHGYMLEAEDNMAEMVLRAWAKR
jgi:hypothetical protein